MLGVGVGTELRVSNHRLRDPCARGVIPPTTGTPCTNYDQAKTKLYMLFRSSESSLMILMTYLPGPSRPVRSVCFSSFFLLFFFSAVYDGGAIAVDTGGGTYSGLEEAGGTGASTQAMNDTADGVSVELLCQNTTFVGNVAGERGGSLYSNTVSLFFYPSYTSVQYEVFIDQNKRFVYWWNYSFKKKTFWLFMKKLRFRQDT